MTISQHVKTFADRPVRKFKVNTETPEDPAGVAWRLTTNYEDGVAKFNRRLEALLAAPWAGQVTALVIGMWGGESDDGVPIDRMVAAAGALTNLTALFVGDIVGEENEISWIQQDDVTPLLRAYPRLEQLRVRGGQGLELNPIRHEALETLIIETGGLSGEFVRGLSDCDLPALRHLELWLGTDNYGGDAVPDDLAQILSGSHFPALEYLGLRNSEIADLLAAALAGAPIVGRLKELDLSMGMLSDAGAAALLAGQPLTHLRKLDLHRHYLSDGMLRRLHAELDSTDVVLDVSGAEGADTDEDERYVAVSE